MQIHHSIQ